MRATSSTNGRVNTVVAVVFVAAVNQMSWLRNSVVHSALGLTLQSKISVSRSRFVVTQSPESTSNKADLLLCCVQ